MPALAYALTVSELLACPFCRELFERDEAKLCPHCEVDLRPLDKLPPSAEAIAEEIAEGEYVPPEDRTMPWTYAGRGRAALVLLAVAGLAVFFAPWVDMSKPNDILISGFDLARGRAGWLWGGAVAWFVMIPLVLTRRTIMKMRGVRIITVLFAAMTLGEVIMLWSLPPQGHRLVPVDFTWGWGLYASFLVSALGVYFGARFGGKLDDLKAAPWQSDDGSIHVDRSDGQLLH